MKGQKCKHVKCYGHSLWTMVPSESTVTVRSKQTHRELLSLEQDVSRKSETWAGSVQGHKAARFHTLSVSQTDRQTQRQTDRRVVWGKTGTWRARFDSHDVLLGHSHSWLCTKKKLISCEEWKQEGTEDGQQWIKIFQKSDCRTFFLVTSESWRLIC